MPESSLKRLAYAPKAYAFIYSRKEGRVVDVSNDIVSGSVNRYVNKPSEASLVLRNDNRFYTGNFNPKFYPMDGITIWLQKYAEKPIQVFTGYIDSIPFFQAYPDKIEIKSTCTLKRFLYTHYDPGVGFIDWISKKGWAPYGDIGAASAFFNPEIFNSESTLAESSDGSADGGMGQLLRDFLIEIGGVDSNAVVIGDLPRTLPKTMIGAYLKRVQASQSAEKALIPALEKFVSVKVDQGGQAALDQLGDDIPTGLSSTVSATDINELTSSIDRFRQEPKPTVQQMLLAALIMSGLDKEYNGQVEGPGAGRGFFAESPGPNSPGAEAANYFSTSEQGKRFCLRFSQVNKTKPSAGETLTDKDVDQVAATLAFGYGKDKYYSQIIEAARNKDNIDAVKKIANVLRTNKNFEDVASLDVLTAAEVEREKAPSNVTWQTLFDSSVPDELRSIPIPDHSDNASSVSVRAGETYKLSALGYKPKIATITSDDFLKIETGPDAGKKLLHTDVKYYFYTSLQKKDAGATGSNQNLTSLIDGLRQRQVVTITNPQNGKSCRCVFLGQEYVKNTPSSGGGLAGRTLPLPPVLLSIDSLSALGISANQNGGTKHNDLVFQPTEEAMPRPNANELKTSYLSRIKSFIGFETSASSGPYRGANITQKDRDIYNKHYKNKSNDRLAEYFYIASAHNLRISDAQPATNQLIVHGEEKNSGANGVKRFLTSMGIARPGPRGGLTINPISPTVAKEIAFTLDGGQTVTSITFNNAETQVRVFRSSMDGVSEAVISLQRSSSTNSPSSYAVSIVSDTTYPKPVWDGESVHLPEDSFDSDGDNDTFSGDTLTWSDLGRISTAAAFSTLTAFPFDIVGSAFLLGEKSLMNDVPLISGIDQLCAGSMRQFMSLPNGQFCAFYPDHFGVFGRKPYLNIRDIEVIDLNIVLNDDALVTHMYVNGNTYQPFKQGVDVFDQVLSVGVVTVDDVFKRSEGLSFINRPEEISGDLNYSEENIKLINEVEPAGFSQFYEGIEDETLRFLQTYGTRPKIINEPLIRSPWFEFVEAYNQFSYHWAMQTATTVSLTFMPEMFAGGLVRFVEHGIIMYVEGVSHTWDYGSGFETSAYLAAPSTEEGGDARSVPGMVLFGAFMKKDQD